MKNSIKILLSIFIVIFLSACFCKRNTPCTTETIKNTTWIPLYLEGQSSEIKTPTENGKCIVFISFDADNKLNGNSGNNLYGGEYSLSKYSEFKTDKLFSTRRMGPNDKYEDLFLKALSETDKVKLEDGKLNFYGKNKLKISFKKVDKNEISQAQ